MHENLNTNPAVQRLNKRRQMHQHC